MRAHRFATALAVLRTRALLRGLGLSALIACAGCREETSQVASSPSEADLTCYWSAETHAGEPDVRRALADGLLDEAECREVIMPHVVAGNARALIEAKADAIRAASEASPLQETDR